MAKKNKKQMGFMWYPKDWASSQRVRSLKLSERGLYRELIDLCMMNKNKVLVDLRAWSRQFNSDARTLEKSLRNLRELQGSDGINLVEIRENYLSIPSCEERLKIIETASINGSMGGRPANNKEENGNPNPNQTVTQSESQIQNININSLPKGRERDSTNPPPDPKKPKKEKRTFTGTLAEREELFRQSLIPFAGTGDGQYPKEMVRAFFDKWKEPDHAGKKMRFELEKTWSTAGRLATWKRLSGKFDNAKSETNASDVFDDSQFNFKD